MILTTSSGIGIGISLDQDQKIGLMIYTPELERRQMNPRHPIDSRHSSMLLLDTHLDGIREEFDRLNKELDNARKQRDEYKVNYGIKAKELQELKQIVSRRAPDRDRIICQHCEREIGHTCRVTGDNSSSRSPTSSSSEYYSILEGEDATSGRFDNMENPNESDRSDRETEEGEVAETPTEIEVSSESNATPADEPAEPGWHIEVNSDAETALNLNLVHKFPQEGITYVTFSRDGKLLATLSKAGVVHIFDVETGERIRDLYEKPDAKVFYNCVGLSPDSKYLATGSMDGQVRVWIVSKRRVQSIFRHGKEVYDLDFSPNGQYVAACSIDVTVSVWRLRDGFFRVFTGIRYPWSIRFSPDGRYIASGDFFAPIAIWNVRTGKLVTRWQGHDNVVESLAFTPDGKGLLSGSWDKLVIHWDISSLRSLGMTRLDGADDWEETDVINSARVPEISRLVGHTDRVRTLSISSDGNWIASGSRDMTVRIWNVHNSTLQRTLCGRGIICSVNFSPVGNYLAIGDRTGQVTIWSYTDL